MLKAKSFKVILGALATVMLSLALFFSVGIKGAKAESASVDFLTITSATVNAQNTDNLEFDVLDGATIKLNNDLVLNDLAIELKTLNVSKVDLTFKTASNDVNGEEVEHKIQLPIGSALIVNGASSSQTVDGDFTVYFDLDNKNVGASLDKTNFTYSSSEFGAENIDKCIAKEITLTFTAGADAKVNLVSIDQNYNDNLNTYKQTFNKVEGEYAKKASARLSLNNNKSLYVLAGDEYQAKIVAGVRCDLNVNAYSVLGNDTKATYFIEKDTFTGEWLSNETSPKAFVYKTVGDKTFTVQSKDKTSFETFSVQVVDGDVDTTAPTYVNNEEALKNFKAKLDEATHIVEDGKTYSIRLGENVKIPSLKNLISEDLTAYGDLKAKVYYNTPSASDKTTSTMEITVDEAGEYSFYVIFTDAKGNALEKKDFIVDSEDSTSGLYKDFVFSFEVKDDAPISVSAIEQDNGYIGTIYRASEFTIKYKGYTPSYKLYYNAVKDAEVGELSVEDGWIEIPASAKIKETDTFENGLTYDKIKDIAYNGALVFKPDQAGKYVIKCTVTSSKSVRTAEAYSEIVVEKAQTVVKPASDWLENNVWSVVFLGVGTLCLIAIVALLCIKPKDKKND